MPFSEQCFLSVSQLINENAEVVDMENAGHPSSEAPAATNYFLQYISSRSAPRAWSPALSGESLRLGPVVTRGTCLRAQRSLDPPAPGASPVLPREGKGTCSQNPSHRAAPPSFPLWTQMWRGWDGGLQQTSKAGPQSRGLVQPSPGSDLCHPGLVPRTEPGGPVTARLSPVTRCSLPWIWARRWRYWWWHLPTAWLPGCLRRKARPCLGDGPGEQAPCGLPPRRGPMGTVTSLLGCLAPG